MKNLGILDYVSRVTKRNKKNRPESTVSTDEALTLSNTEKKKNSDPPTMEYSEFQRRPVSHKNKTIRTGKDKDHLIKYINTFMNCKDKETPINRFLKRGYCKTLASNYPPEFFLSVEEKEELKVQVKERITKSFFSRIHK